MRWEGCHPPRPLCDAIGCWVGSCDRCVLLHLMCHLPLRPHWRMFCGAQRVHLMIPREGMVGRRRQDGVSMHGKCNIFYSGASLQGTSWVHCPLFRGCPLLRGNKCTITMGMESTCPLFRGCPRRHSPFLHLEELGVLEIAGTPWTLYTPLHPGGQYSPCRDSHPKWPPESDESHQYCKMSTIRSMHDR